MQLMLIKSKITSAVNEQITDYIKQGLKKRNEKELYQQFDFLLSSSNWILTCGINDAELINQMLIVILSVRVGMGHTKSYESISGKLDYVLAYEALKLARLIFTGEELKEYIKSVLYYEKNIGARAMLENELSEM